MADSTICIWTPQGLKCSASPINTHGPTACVHGDINARQMVKNRHATTNQLLQGELGRLAADDPWQGPKPGTGHEKRARVIARVVELLYAADVDDQTSFTIVKF